ncbi:hypothetical protein V6N13_054385 [Hibiscus sabdariffa]|uniref:Jacalin-type lectin domain-containing protein n=1 Tax=Hibiscus sabdariffa TaxID=183260 RepID=A0ABR2DXZ8_9ROSI
MSLVEIGPLGNDNLGYKWSEKGNDKITDIYISHFPSSIASLQFQYVNQYGQQVLSRLYGTSNGSKFNVLKLDSSEYITGVKGSFDPVNGIRSLTFITDKRQFGPFGFNGKVGGGAGGSGSADGCSKVTPFDLKFGLSRRFGGFNGRTRNGLVTSIGGYVKTVAP